MGDKDSESPCRLVSSGLSVPGEPGIVVQEQDPFGDLPAAFKCPSIVPVDKSNTSR
jgi:hypothetical protein